MWRPPILNLYVTGGQRVRNIVSVAAGRMQNLHALAGGNTANPPVFCKDGGGKNVILKMEARH